MSSRPPSRIVILSLAAICAASSPRLASAEQTLTWKAAVEEASNGNAELRSARQALLSNEYARRGAFGAFLPQVSGTLSYSYGTSTVGGTGNAGLSALGLGGTEASRSYTASLSASEDVFSGFRDKAAIDQAAANARLAAATLDLARARVSYDLKSAYASLLFAEQSVRLQDEIIKRRQQNFKLVGLRFDSGRENRGSVLLSQANLKQARYDALRARHGIDVSRADLLRVFGRDDDAEIAVEEDIPLEPITEATPPFKTLAATTPELRQDIAREDAADAAVTIARSDFFPTLDLTATTGRTGHEWFPQNERWSIGANLTIPLFSGGRNYYGAKGAIASRAAAGANRENTSRAELSKLKRAYTAYVEASEKLQVDESFRTAALKRSEIARSKYNNGLMTFEDWDIIENDLINRETTALASRRDLAIAEAAWQQARGQGVIP